MHYSLHNAARRRNTHSSRLTMFKAVISITVPAIVLLSAYASVHVAS